MKAKVEIVLKPGLLDTQGNTTQQALETLGFKGIAHVRVGKLIEITLKQSSADAARRHVERMCEKLLANPVIETYRITINK